MKKSKTRVQFKMNSPIGPLYLVVSDKGLSSVSLKREDVPFIKSLRVDGPEAEILADVVKEMREYFSGKRKIFNLPFDVEGTSFQKKVWKELTRIDYGRTSSYQDIARKIKLPKAARAVGNANGKNPLCIVIPCHRVIAADGSLGGYSGGIHIKKKLLAIEQRS